MKNWEETLVNPETSLREVLAIIDRLGCQMVLVVDNNRRLLGTLSDGDARRALLAGGTLTDKAANAMQRKPTVAFIGETRASRLNTMKHLGLHQLPLVNQNQIVVGLDLIDDFFETPQRDEWVIIMAGGLGSRLNQLTEHTPKPMLKVGSKPILETILRNFIEQGFHQFYLAVNYKAEQIEQYFGDGSAFGVTINYLKENKRMGTAGALSLLPQKLEHPCIVTNGDLLTRENFALMLERHLAEQADATMGIRNYEMQVPFGVVREQAGRILAIEEKPMQYFTISAGMYVLSPNMMSLLSKDSYCDMPELFEKAIHAGLHVRCHPVESYWLDIGRPAEYERANFEFSEVFR